MTNAQNPLRTPFAPFYADRVRDWEEVMGYEVATSIEGLDAEYAALRNTVAVLDYTQLYKWFVEGPQARQTVNSVFSRDVTELAPSRIAYGVVVNDDGGMVDDVTVAALTEESFLVIGGNPEVLEALRDAAPAGTTVEERRESLVVLSIQGPKSRTLLQRLTDADVSNESFPYYTAKTDVTVAGVPATLLRLGFTAELGYEIMVAAEHAATFYTAVFAQDDLGVVPLGGETLMVARLEAGLMLGHLDYDETVTPFECRLGWVVDLDKAPFRGQRALAERKATAPIRVVTVTSELSPDSLEGATLQSEGADVGVVTMAISSPTLGGTTAGLARVAKEASAVGTRLTVTVEGTEYPVEVRPTPIYDPERLRVRS